MGMIRERPYRNNKGKKGGVREQKEEKLKRRTNKRQIEIYISYFSKTKDSEFLSFIRHLLLLFYFI